MSFGKEENRDENNFIFMFSFCGWGGGGGYETKVLLKKSSSTLHVESKMCFELYRLL